MGIIGLYDADAEKYIHTVFNLELMKLSAYFKKKRDIVTMVPSFCPEKYTTFYYRKDYNDNDFPKNLTKIPNLVYGGLAFSNNNYIPLDNNIEKMIPDISIYQPTKIRFCSSSEKEEYYNIMNHAIHCRLSLDGKTIWNDFSSQLPVIKTKSTLFIHDFNLGHIDGDYETIKELLLKMRQTFSKARLAAKYPIEIRKPDEILKWSQINSSSLFFTLSYNGILSDEVIYELIKNDFAIGKKLEYDITNLCYNENHFFNYDLPQIFKQIIFSRSHYVKILLKYDEDFLIQKGWKEIIDLLNSFSCSLFDSGLSKDRLDLILKDDSLYGFVSNLPEKAILKNYNTDKIRARKAFSIIRDKNYELFKDFYECHQVSFKGGNFCNE